MKPEFYVLQNHNLKNEITEDLYAEPANATWPNTGPFQDA